MDLEVAKSGSSKSCDIRAKFPSWDELYIEVKAQSGQQHGDRHPLSSEAIGFTPKSEEDLRRWLFEERTSSLTGELMKPCCRQAAEKGADVLIAMTDIFPEEHTDMLSLGKRLTNAGRVWCRRVARAAKLQLFIVKGDEGVLSKMCGLKEVWVLNDSRSNEVLVIRARESNAVL